MLLIFSELCLNSVLTLHIKHQGKHSHLARLPVSRPGLKLDVRAVSECAEVFFEALLFGLGEGP